MPLYVMIGYDAPGKAELRQEVRPAHLEAMQPLLDAGRLRQAGPMLDDGGAPMGSVVFFEAATLDEARAIAARDPYVTQGVFERHEVHETRVVLPAP